MRPGQDERITHLFRRGYSLDLVSEFGLLYGWTRKEAREVVAAHGWALDYSGRLQPQFLGGKLHSPDVASADPEHLLNVGVDHEDPDIRRAAHNAERMLEKLRNALLRREQRDADLAAQRRRASEAVADTFRAVLGHQEESRAS